MRLPSHYFNDHPDQMPMQMPAVEPARLAARRVKTRPRQLKSTVAKPPARVDPNRAEATGQHEPAKAGKPVETDEPATHAIGFDGALVRSRHIVLLPVKFFWVVTGAASDNAVTALMIGAVRSRTLKFVCVGLKAVYFGGFLVGAGAIANEEEARKLGVKHHHHARKADPTIGEELDGLLRSLDPFPTSK